MAKDKSRLNVGCLRLTEDNYPAGWSAAAAAAAVVGRGKPAPEFRVNLIINFDIYLQLYIFLFIPYMLFASLNSSHQRKNDPRLSVTFAS